MTDTQTPAYRLPLSGEDYDAAHVQATEPAPPPGSVRACRLGCCCGAQLNVVGKGIPAPSRFGGTWWHIHSGCPLHGANAR